VGGVGRVILPTVDCSVIDMAVPWSVFERIGRRFAQRKRVKTKSWSPVLIQSEPIKIEANAYFSWSIDRAGGFKQSWVVVRRGAMLL
jgi:hypothetical protein